MKHLFLLQAQHGTSHLWSDFSSEIGATYSGSYI